ncbi:hypothetical protein Taro_042941 [Colocasia esculenta]|uniref:Secreted protein n=1 Tax=Colocasia esculenta TaxID=4460 RepID=A0A843WZL7_COLES|nr:hypothetical protein [Colocasia esculenta]
MCAMVLAQLSLWLGRYRGGESSDRPCTGHPRRRWAYEGLSCSTSIFGKPRRHPSSGTRVLSASPPASPSGDTRGSCHGDRAWCPQDD